VLQEIPPHFLVGDLVEARHHRGAIRHAPPTIVADAQSLGELVRPVDSLTLLTFVQ
jgi:hypothetical protein